MTLLAPTLQAFFTDRLIRQTDASPNTIAAYRDAMRLLLGFASDTTGTPPSQLDVDQIDAALISAFLDHLEHDRGNSPATRNAAWPRSGRCSATPPYGTPSMPA